MEIIIQPLLARDLVSIRKEELTHSVLTNTADQQLYDFLMTGPLLANNILKSIARWIILKSMQLTQLFLLIHKYSRLI